MCSSIAYLFLPSSAQLSLDVVLYTQLDASKLLHRLLPFPYLTFCVFFCLTPCCTSLTSTTLSEDICDLWLPYCQNPWLIAVFIWELMSQPGMVKVSSQICWHLQTSNFLFNQIVCFVYYFVSSYMIQKLFFLDYFSSITLISSQAFKYHHLKYIIGYYCYFLKKLAILIDRSCYFIYFFY